MGSLYLKAHQLFPDQYSAIIAFKSHFPFILSIYHAYIISFKDNPNSNFIIYEVSISQLVRRQCGLDKS